eukprot:TRINITY_DN37760_c0_g1_i1.p1 TRINITY_DN37760_c0_g1~~TRINITY_DN37760_c0_g1_i1.p1  ORF type:complete len:439 (+),score=70.37 TRINITY_DN37760_c0_g1_i1:43-1359(+)
MASEGDGDTADLVLGSRVLIFGLKSKDGAPMNFQAGKVVHILDDRSRFGITLLANPSAPKLLKRMNLLSASSLADRQLFLELLTLHYSREMRVARPALNTLLQEDYGLLLLVSSYLTHPRECLYQFGGYMGKVWEEHWCYADPSKPLALTNRPKPRLDAASSDMGLGRVLFAGGCGQHPQRCRSREDFFKSAEIYDALTDEWTAISDMPTRRHGACACLLDDKVYVLGGMYVDEGDAPMEERFCDVFDTRTQQWSTLPASSYDHVLRPGLFDHAAFFGAAAVSGRVVALIDGATIAYNPSVPEDGWREVEEIGPSNENLSNSSCACAHNGELVVASGRPPRVAKTAFAFAFAKCDGDRWWRGSWRTLPTLRAARVGGSLAVVRGRLYVTGGVDEVTGQFSKDAERLAVDESSWESVPWFEMPRALHAHDTFTLPYLRF